MKKTKKILFVLVMTYISFVIVLTFPAFDAKANNLDAYSSFGMGKSVNVAIDSYLDSNQIGSAKNIFDAEWLEEWLSQDESLIDYGNDTYETVFSNSSIDKMNINFKNSLNLTHEEGMLVEKWFNSGLELEFNIDGSIEFSKYYYKYFYKYSSYHRRYNRTLLKSNGVNEYQDHLDQTFKGFLNLLFNNVITPKIFFDTYGTHAIIEGIYGGCENITYTAVQNQVDLYGKLDGNVRSAINEGIIKIINIGEKIDFNLGAKLNMSSLASNECIVAKTSGGESFGLTNASNVGSKVNDWAQSLTDKNSALISLTDRGLLPLWELLPKQYQEKKEWFKNECLKYIDENSYNIPKYEFDLTQKVNEESNEIILRTEELIVSNDDFQTNNYDVLNLNFAMEYGPYIMSLLGYNKITVEIKIDIKENQMGYQEIYLFSDRSFGEKYLLASKTNIEHGGSGSPTDYGTDRFVFSGIPIDSLLGDNIYICYGSHGASKNSWSNKNLRVIITYFK